MFSFGDYINILCLIKIGFLYKNVFLGIKNTQCIMQSVGIPNPLYTPQVITAPLSIKLYFSHTYNWLNRSALVNRHITL